MYVWEKSHEPRPLNCRFNCALLFCRQTSSATAYQSSVRIDELPQEIDVFVINVLDIVLRENVI